MPSKEPSRTKQRNARIAAQSAALPKIPKEVLDQIVADGPLTAQDINATTMALKKAPRTQKFRQAQSLTRQTHGTNCQ